tara:strand:- start:13646 stop:14194 length:549 start_codon:yes stop_codon:yes gene_type:complete
VTAAESLDESEHNYQATLNVIPGTLHERLLKPSGGTEMPVSTRPAWCLCEIPEGDYSRVRVFPDLEHLLMHVAKLEGEEVSVWIFYGTPLRFTYPDVLSGQRYLLTSDQEVVPISSRGSSPPVYTAMENQILPEIQEDGWLGDEAFTQGNTEAYYAYEAPQDDQFDTAVEDDNDDEGEEVDA